MAVAVAGGWPWPWPGGRGRGRVAVAGWPWPGRGRGRSGRQLKKAIVLSPWDAKVRTQPNHEEDEENEGKP